MSISSEDEWDNNDEDAFLFDILCYYRRFPRTDSFEDFVHSRKNGIFLIRYLRLGVYFVVVSFKPPLLNSNLDYLSIDAIGFNML